jgi:ABC-type Fe3+ transport system permease subunit
MIHFIPQIIAAVGDACTPHSGSFLGFPTWYKYLPGIEAFNGKGQPTSCIPQVSQLADVWLIVAAFVEILLRIAGLAAIVFVIYGGIQYINSHGEPDKTNRARQTIINALAGLVIAVGATVLVTFFAGRFK